MVYYFLNFTMKVFVLLCSHEMDPQWINNIIALRDSMIDQDVEYCGISNQDDFHHYESIITFKYKVINPNRQLSKVCDFISSTELDYDWYMKIRPDIKLLEPIPFSVLSKEAINARARVYYGPRNIPYGMSINGEGIWKDIGDSQYDEVEHDIIVDDMLFLFHNNLKRAFEPIQPEYDTGEWGQALVFNQRNIPVHVIGIHVENTKYNTFSGNTLKTNPHL